MKIQISGGLQKDREHPRESSGNLCRTTLTGPLRKFSKLERACRAAFKTRALLLEEARKRLSRLFDVQRPALIDLLF
jgi:hypothetical protein